MSVGTLVRRPGFRDLLLGQGISGLGDWMGTVAFMAYGLGWIPNMIWFGGSTKSFWTYLFDSAIYASLTAGVFGWLWMR